jgi:ubiquitin-protein ligase
MREPVGVDVTAPRTRRLLAEHDALRSAFAAHPHITVEPIGWHPAERYRVTFEVPGVALDASGQPELVHGHVVSFTAGAQYPREQPVIVAESAIFHPNVESRVGGEIVVSEPWTAARTLTETILLIGAMLQFQRYDLSEPANDVAARWVAENETIFPLGHVELRADEPDGADEVEEPASPASHEGSRGVEPSVWAPPSDD